MTLGVNASYYNQYPQPQYLNQVNPGTRAQVNFQGQTQAQKPDAVADGRDDGKIGFWRATGHILKGAAKFFTGMFTDKDGNPSLLQTLKTLGTVAVVGGICVLTAGTAVPAMLAAAGIGLSAWGVGSSAINVMTSDTDAEMIAACESFGSNSVALGLAVAGARASAKSLHTEQAAAGEFDGVKGTFNAVKTTFKDAAKPFAESFKGVYTAYKDGTGVVDSVTDAASKFGKNVRTQWQGEDGISGFKGKVSENYNKAINVNKSLDDELASIDKKRAKYEKQLNKAEAADKAKYQTKIDKLDARKEAITEMKNVKTWEEGTKQVKATETELNNAKAELKNATAEEKATCQAKVDKLDARLKAQKEVLARRTSQAQGLRDQIAAKEKALKNAKDAENPNQTRITNLKSELDALKAKEGFLPKEVNQKVIKSKLSESKEALKTETNETTKTALENNINRYQEALEKGKVATGGGQRSYVTKEFGRTIINDLKDLKSPNPWLTAGITGKSYQSSTESEFYSRLTPEEKEQFRHLPKEVKEAILSQYAQVA